LRTTISPHRPNAGNVSAAIVWMGGVSFMLFALRPAAMDLPPPQRLPLMAQVLMRFFRLVWLCIGLLLATGLVMLLGVGMKQAPVGWHLMLGIGLLMFAVFGHLYFGPFRRLRAAVAAADWQRAGQSSPCRGNTCPRRDIWQT